MYPPLYLKWITNRVLLYSTGNSAQCYVAAWMEEGFGGEWIHVYAWLSLSTVLLKLSTLFVNWLCAGLCLVTQLCLTLYNPGL